MPHPTTVWRCASEAVQRYANFSEGTKKGGDWEVIGKRSF